MPPPIIITLRIKNVPVLTIISPSLSCAQINVSGGSGSYNPSSLLSFPGAYSMSDPGLAINLYWPIPTEYM